MKADWINSSHIQMQDKLEFVKIYNENSAIKIQDLFEKTEAYRPYLILRTLAWVANMYVNNHKSDFNMKNSDLDKKLKKFVETDYIDIVIKDHQ